MRSQLLREEVQRGKRAVAFDVRKADRSQWAVVRRAREAIGVRKQAAVDALAMLEIDGHRLRI